VTFEFLWYYFKSSKRVYTHQILSLSYFFFTSMSEAKVQLLGVLAEATSQDYNRMRQAEDMLRQWENAPSFFATLQVPIHIFNQTRARTHPT
jgi:hypothetical protein